MLSSRVAASARRGLATSHAHRVVASTSCLEVSELAPYVVGVKMNRPKQRNALTFDMWKEMSSVFGDLGEDPKCRVIILSGAGKSFCAGIDLKEGVGPLMALIQNDELDISRKGRELAKKLKVAQDGFTAVEKCPKPVIGAVHAHCVGAGINLLSSCDIRLASQDAVFSIKEVDIGIAADVGVLQRMPKGVGNDSLMRELALTARDFGSDEASRIGFLSRVYPDAESTFSEALQLAKTIAEKSPVAVQGTKIHLNYSRDHTADEGLEYIRTWNMSQLLSEDLLKAGMAAINKSKTTFNDV